MEALVFALGAAWAVLFAFRPYALSGSPVLIPLAGTVAIGLVQLMIASTVNRWETWNAVLKWSVYLTAFFLASQLLFGGERPESASEARYFILRLASA